MGRVIYQGKIDTDFEGFNDNVIFKMANGTYWIQAQYNYWYHYAYRPDALITEENGRNMLTVAGNSIPVRRLDSIIESQIDGEFNGWDGSKHYKLVNGQVWQQAEYKYEYKYAYRPEVIVCDVGGTYIMSVEGTTVPVRRIR
jgi:hypothetical protein